MFFRTTAARPKQRLPGRGR
jgi:hypothetical protein